MPRVSGASDPESMSPRSSVDHEPVIPRTARFGPYELDLRSGELHRDGTKVRLQEQPTKILAMLVGRAGEMVSREELRAHLWPTEYVDFDHGLNAAIRKLRQALEDSAENPRFVETVARRGYRFIAAVEWTVPPTTAPEPAPTPTPIRRWPWRRLALASAIAVFVASAAVALLPRSRQATDAHSVAVLPFVDQSGELAPLADGITEILINTLADVPGTRVMARSTVFHFNDRDRDPRVVGKELGVGRVVVGSVRRERERYSIHVEIVDVEDGRQVWGKRFDGATADLPAMQSRISDELVTQLERRSDVPRVARTHTTNPRAYELYLQGLHAWNKRGRADLQKSVELFRAATDHDPSYADAYAGLANSYGVMLGYGWIPPEHGTPKVIAAAKKALELDPLNAEAHTTLATVKFRQQWDFAGAERDYRRALALDPNYATGHQWYSGYLRAMGRFDEARREAERAYALDPFSSAINAEMCWTLYFERRFREAVEFARNAERMDRRFGAPGCVIRSLGALGDYAGVLTELDNDERYSPSERATLREAYRRGGSRGFLTEHLLVIEARQPVTITKSLDLAELHALLGNRDAAFSALEVAYRDRSPRLADLRVHPSLDALCSDPRFGDLTRRIGLPASDCAARPRA